MVDTILTTAGIFLIWRTLIHTRRAANAATQAVKEAKEATRAAESSVAVAQETARLELRAYLSVEPAGINRMRGSDNAIGHVNVKNVGKLPAQDVFVHVSLNVAPRYEIDFPVTSDWEKVSRTIQPGTEMRQGSKETPPASQLIVAGDHVFVWGVVYYGDGHGERRQTRFCHRYASASHNQFGPMTPVGTDTSKLIGADKARYHTHGNEAT